MIEKEKFNLEFIEIYSDGGSRGNPGPSAAGFVIYDAEGSTIVRSAQFIGITTNNQAEYISIKNGLDYASRLGVKDVRVYMDSMLVINQMKGIFKVKNRELWSLHQSVSELASHFPDITFSHVPRENNKAADAVVNESLDAGEDILYE